MSVPEQTFPPDVFLLAPLSGYTDLAFRNSCRRQGCHYAFAPLIDSGSLLHRHDRQIRELLRGVDEPWLGAQLLGASPEVLGPAARILNDHPFDLVDLNAGCPVPKITRRGCGAALGADRSRAARCAAALVSACRVPVTAKIRIQDASDPGPTVALAKALEESGIRALTIHGRTREQLYSGPVATEVIRAVREALRIPVVANGGVFDRATALDLVRSTGCTRVMIARGAIGHPWIFREVLAPNVPPPAHEELCRELELHTDEMIALYGESSGLRHGRKIILAYLTGRGYRRCRRQAAAMLSTKAEFHALLDVIRAEGPSPHSQRPVHDGNEP